MLTIALFSAFILVDPLNMSAENPFTLSRYINIDPMQSRLRKFSGSHQDAAIELLRSAYADLKILNATDYFSADFLNAAGLESLHVNPYHQLCDLETLGKNRHTPIGFFFYEPQAMGLPQSMASRSVKVVILYAAPELGDGDILFIMDCDDHLYIMPRPA